MHHLIDLAAYGTALTEVVLRELAIAEDRAQDVVEVVSDTAGKSPERLQFRRLLQLPLHLFARSLLPSVRFLSASALGDVHQRPDKLDVARLVPQGAGHHLDVLDRAIGHLQPILDVKIVFLAPCTIECPLEQSLVLRMRLLDHAREVSCLRAIEFIDSKGFRGPPDLCAGGIPAETARVAQVLRFSQVGLAAP